MDEITSSAQSFGDREARAFDIGPRIDDTEAVAEREMTASERHKVMDAGGRFADQNSGVWILINGRFTSTSVEHGIVGTEGQLKGMLLSAFGYPETETTREAGPDGWDGTLNVLLNSPGGSLDSAYCSVLCLSAFATQLNVYVPVRAKSASTLIALGADNLYMSAFGELGPLDTQIPDPRNPANTLSALDCYQSVDYVRNFGLTTIDKVLPLLGDSTDWRVPINDLLRMASSFALASIAPMLDSVTALDFGGWGRSLRIGEYYAWRLLKAKATDNDDNRIDRITQRLVYGYTHHLFPIDIHEARQIGLSVSPMAGKVYELAVPVIAACRKKDFVGFLNEKYAGRDTTPHGPANSSNGRGKVRRMREEHAKGEAEQGSELG